MSIITLHIVCTPTPPTAHGSVQDLAENKYCQNILSQKYNLQATANSPYHRSVQDLAAAASYSASSSASRLQSQAWLNILQ